MTFLDYTVMAIVLVSITFGVIRGLVREILSLLGWIAAFYIANHYGSVVAPVLPELVHGERLRLIVAFAALFIGTLIVSGLIGVGVGLLLRGSGLQLVDRALGGVFGFARGVLIVLIGVMLLELTSVPEMPIWRQSIMAPLAEQGVEAARPYLSTALGRHVRA